MKVLFLLCVLINSLFAQELPKKNVVTYEQLKLQLDDQKFQELLGKSKNHIVVASKFAIKETELEFVNAELMEIDEETAASDESQIGPIENIQEKTLAESAIPFCLKAPVTGQNPIGTLENLTQSVDEIQKKEKKKRKAIYITWGYNRDFHSKSDATFETKEGTFTIHDAVGHDRQSHDWKDYVYPSRLPIPQYNLSVGYEVNDHWDIVAGLDHMKWVFQNQLKYKVTGDYSHTVFVPNETGDGLQGLNFDQVKETGDVRWLYWDHTNGYNYVFVEGVYKNDLFTSRNGDFKLSTGIGLGAGLMVPQTTVKYHQDGWYNYDGVDNEFHIAGFGASADARLKIQYKNLFLEPIVKGSYIKINNALVQKSGEKLTHSPIGSIQFIVQAGYRVPIGKKEKKRVLK